MDLLDMSELQDMAKTISELKNKVEKLQNESTRATRQLNTLSTDKAQLSDQILAAENRAHQVEYLTDVNMRQTEDLAVTKAELVKLRREHVALSADLKDSQVHVRAVLGTEMSFDGTLACVVRRLQSIMQEPAQSAEARKMACVLSPDDFRAWLLSHDPHVLTYQKHPVVAAGRASQYLRKLRC